MCVRRGGAQVYADAWRSPTACVITHVEQSPMGDTYFPELDWSA
jgi:dihydrofolate reductase